ncbi:MAG: hypothetical protein U0599_24780 [Vicinamibacteria bacterium]
MIATAADTTTTAAAAAVSSRFVRRALSAMARANASSTAVSPPRYRSRHSSNSRYAVPVQSRSLVRSFWSQR